MNENETKLREIIVKELLDYDGNVQQFVDNIVSSVKANPLDLLVSGKFAEETFEFIIDHLLENRPLYRDSGLWQIRTDDMEELLYQQSVNETFIEFINRVFKSENQLQDL